MGIFARGSPRSRVLAVIPVQEKRGSAVQRAELGTGAIVSTLQVGSAETEPVLRSEDLRGGNVVHVDGDAQHGGQRDEAAPDVAIADRTVVGPQAFITS